MEPAIQIIKRHYSYLYICWDAANNCDEAIDLL